MLKIQERKTMNFIISFLVAIFLFSNAVAEINPRISEMVKLKADKIILPNDPVPQGRVLAPKLPVVPQGPRRDLGERYLAGDTYYDYQSNGSIGKMIAVDEEGGVHTIWMDGEGADLGGANRNMKYGFYTDDEFVEEDGTRVNQGDRGGYGHLILTTEEEPRALAFYHSRGDDDQFSGMCGIDFLLGLGAFQETPLPQYPDDHVYWPQGAMSPDGKIHVVYNRQDAGMISYALGSLDREGNPEFGEFPQQVGETSLNTYRITSSPNSERVAITWVAFRLGLPVPENWAGFLASQMNNDIYMVVSEDGEEWNFEDPINVTSTNLPDPDLLGEAARGDIYLPYCTHDVIFDADDNIHVVFDTRQLLNRADGEGSPPIDGLTTDQSYLYHWSEETDEITPVADGWFSQDEVDENGELIRQPRPGAWKSNVCAPSLAYDENGDLYCVYNYYPADDNSQSYCNGEIYATVSEDNGATWYEPTNITETRTHQAELGEAACELYPSLASKVDEFLHISYVFDTEPGSVIQPQQGDEVATLGFFYYHKVATDDIARDRIWDDGPSFHRELNPVVIGAIRDQATPVPNQEVSITAEVIAQIGELELVVLQWTIDGDLDNIRSIEMENGEDDNYSASIPGAEDGSFIWYKIVATDDEERSSEEPARYWYAYMVRPDGELTISDVQFRPRQTVELPWAVDYSPYKDYEVTVTGVVTTPPVYAELYGAYAIQDAEEEWSGIYIRGVEDVDGINSLRVGDQVTVTGIVRERDPDEAERWRFQTYIEVSDAEVLGRVEELNPIEVELADLRYSRLAENLEGVLVTVTNVRLDSLDAIVEGDNYYPLFDPNADGTGWLALHGIFLDLLEDEFEPPLSDWQFGMTFEVITGILSEDERYGISLRDYDEMILVSAPEISDPMPNVLRLEAAYPNPFNSTTKVEFQLPETGMTKLALYDLSGRNVMDLVNGTASVGNHNITINAADLSTGIYLLRLEAGGASQSLKLVLIK